MALTLGVLVLTSAKLRNNQIMDKIALGMIYLGEAVTVAVTEAFIFLLQRTTSE